MIGFLIFYFVFSAIFAVGVQADEYQGNIPLDAFIMGILLGWLLLPFGLGMLINYIINDKKNE